MSVVGDETYRHAAGTYLTGSAVSGTELLRTRSGGCVASAFIPDAASEIQQSILHAAGPNGGGTMRGDSVAAMWPVLEIVRDIYSQASQGIALTWISSVGRRRSPSGQTHISCAEFNSPSPR